MTKRILIYGDSNTWGSGAFGGRYQKSEQWPNILGSLLGSSYDIVQEGVCGRIAGSHIADETLRYKNGKDHFIVAEHTASPFNLVIVALGTNDIKDKYELTSEQIAEDLLWYQNEVQKFAAADSDMNGVQDVVYVGIADFKPTDYFQADVEKATHVNELLQESGFSVVIPSGLEHSSDGLHYSKEDHRKVARMVHDKIKEMGL